MEDEGPAGIIHENPAPHTESAELWHRNTRAGGSSESGDEQFLLRSVVEEMDDGITIVDRTFCILYANPAQRSKYAYGGPVTGRQCFEAYHARSAPCDGCPVARTFASGGSHAAIISLADKNHGIPRWVNLRSVPVPDPATGSITGAIEYAREISDVMGAESGLHERNPVSDLSNLGLAMVDLSGNLTYATPAFLAMFGYTRPKEVIGRTVTAFSKTPFWVVRALAQGIARGSFAGEFKGKRKDGSLFEVRVSGNPVFDAKHHVLGGLVMFEDVTVRKLNEERQKFLIKKLHLMNSITRHDIKNQLTALTGFLDLCRASAKDSRLNSLLDKEFRIISTINHQLDFAKYYQEIGISEPGWYCLAGVIEKAGRQLFIPSLEIRPPVYRIECFADPLFQKVFYNLFDNSLRHGGDITKIFVDAREDSAGVQIIIEDDGRGIPSDIKEKIFERGFGKNSGFGLFLSREILGITGMSISETGDYGAGARFVILIPKEKYRTIPLSGS